MAGPISQKPDKTDKTILLLQGLPLGKKTSFFYQFSLLGRALSSLSAARFSGTEVVKNSIRVFHAGPMAFDRPWEFQVYRINAIDPQEHNFTNNLSVRTTVVDGFQNLIKGTEASAVILLGYPDQLPILKQERFVGVKRECGESASCDIPLYWWAQLSKTFRGFSLSPLVTSVPLTPINGDLLGASGVTNIGPVIPHGVDTEIFMPAEECKMGCKAGMHTLSNPPSTFFTVGAVGANNRRKRYDDLLEAFSIFIRKFDNAIDRGTEVQKGRDMGPTLYPPGKPRPRLLIKTDIRASPSGWDLEALAEQLGITSYTEINDDEMPQGRMGDIYNCMDVFLSVSEWEGFCIPAVEAMACGVPVIARKGQGPGELLPDESLLLTSERFIDQRTRDKLGESGTKEEFVPTRVDPEETAEVLYRMAEDESLQIRMAQKGLIVVRERFSITKVAESWRDLIFFT